MLLLIGKKILLLTKNYLIFSPKIGVRKTKPIFVKIISNLRKIISNVI